MSKNEILIKKGKKWKLTQSKVSGNFIIYYDGRKKMFNETSEKAALNYVEVVKRLAAKSKKRILKSKK